MGALLGGILILQGLVTDARAESWSAAPSLTGSDRANSPSPRSSAPAKPLPPAGTQASTRSRPAVPSQPGPGLAPVRPPAPANSKPSQAAKPRGAKSKPGTAAKPRKPRRPPTLIPGSRGKYVLKLQKRLKKLRYNPGPVHGFYGTATIMAVWAFQKVNRIKPGAVVGPGTWRALASPKRPKRLVRGGGRDRVEIDLRRQLLFVYHNGRLTLISHISTGANRPYCDNGHCGYAYTPLGDFRTYRATRGWHLSPLGWMYNPIYFKGGYAIHGSLSVPLRPASHGCVRLPMHNADIFRNLVRLGEPVYIRRTRKR